MRNFDDVDMCVECWIMEDLTQHSEEAGEDSFVDTHTLADRTGICGPVLANSTNLLSDCCALTRKVDTLPGGMTGWWYSSKQATNRYWKHGYREPVDPVQVKKKIDDVNDL